MGLGGIKISNLLAKATGIVALGAIAYDAHKYGKEEARKEQRNYKAESLTHHLYNDMRLDSPSFVKSGVKKGLFKMHTDETITSPVNNLKGYLSGVGTTLVNSVVPLVLALGTMVGKVRGGRNIISKLSALGLAAYGGLFVLREGFGVLKSHE